MRLEKVVVAVDFSASSLAAARWIVEHLARDAEVVLAYNLEMPSTPSLLWEVLPPQDVLLPKIERRAEERLAALVAELRCDERFRVRSELMKGHPGEEIAGLAIREGADLVVAGKHGSHHHVWHLLGSTAEQLVAACHRPVLLARNLPPRRLETVLVPIDDSEAAARALAWGATLARREEAQLVAHHVVTEWYYHRVRELESEDKARDVQERVTERAKKWMKDFVTQNAQELPVIEHLKSGQTGFETLAAIESFKADLVVVGSHGVKSMIGDPLARLSRFLIMAAPCSVFVVPDEEGSPA